MLRVSVASLALLLTASRRGTTGRSGFGPKRDACGARPASSTSSRRRPKVLWRQPIGYGMPTGGGRGKCSSPTSCRTGQEVRRTGSPRANAAGIEHVTV